MPLRSSCHCTICSGAAARCVDVKKFGGRQPSKLHDPVLRQKLAQVVDLDRKRFRERDDRLLGRTLAVQVEARLVTFPLDVPADDRVHPFLFRPGRKLYFDVGFARAVLDELAEFLRPSQMLLVVSTLAHPLCSSQHADRRHTIGPHPSPKQIAHTSVLLPVPFGPITMFRLGPR